jgi:hypothetical protein
MDQVLFSYNYQSSFIRKYLPWFFRDLTIERITLIQKNKFDDDFEKKIFKLKKFTRCYIGHISHVRILEYIFDLEFIGLERLQFGTYNLIKKIKYDQFEVFNLQIVKSDKKIINMYMIKYDNSYYIITIDEFQQKINFFCPKNSSDLLLYFGNNFSIDILESEIDKFLFHFRSNIALLSSEINLDNIKLITENKKSIFSRYISRKDL